MLSERYRQAVAASELSVLPDETLEVLTASATFLDVPAGGVFLRLGSTDAFVCVVVEGLIRAFLTSSEGRQMTVRYSRPGDITGTATVFARPLPNSSFQAVIPSNVLVLQATTLRELAQQDLPLANILLVDLAERTTAYISALASTTLSSLRQNVVRHLLDLADVDKQNERLVAPVSQQQLADSVGTVREVVGRILREFKDQGLLLTGRDEIVLLDAPRLRELTWPRVY